VETLFGELGNWSPIEAVAASLGVAYVVLAARQIVWCWPCAIISTGLYSGIFFELALYQQALLQLFYVGLGFYGWRKWLHGGARGTELKVSKWPATRHATTIAFIVAFTLATGWITETYTTNPMPYLDAFTAWGGVLASWMMARKVLENWLYWIVFDSVMILLSWRATLPATALLFAVYVGMAVVGYIGWRRTLELQAAGATG
jgi:nicotinamide mononucleotide transporter